MLSVRSMFLGLCILCSPVIHGKTYLTFYLGGQSNMEGYGANTDLPQSLQGEQKVMVFHGNGVFDNQNGGGIGIWEPLRSGHGTGFKATAEGNQLSANFGPELSFGQQMAKAFPNANIAIIKYAVGGTGLALNTGYGNWSPDFAEGQGVNQYDNALTTIRNALSVADIDGDGTRDTLVPAGIIWMQGEADAHASRASANNYLNNLTRLMDLLRAAMHQDGLPVVIGKITNSGLSSEPIMPYIEVVQAAQAYYVQTDGCAAYMTDTDSYQYDKRDAWHYISPSVIDMGRAFAITWQALYPGCAQLRLLKHHMAKRP